MSDSPLEEARKSRDLLAHDRRVQVGDGGDSNRRLNSDPVLWEFAGDVRKTLLDIVATEISPELLPTGIDGQATHSTEGLIGPYELHDFFLFHFLRYGAPPEKILYLAGQAKFEQSFGSEELRHWMRIFLTRFFASQFKRSCVPNAPKVGSGGSLSPRGDWRAPSDSEATVWKDDLATVPDKAA